MSKHHRRDFFSDMSCNVFSAVNKFLTVDAEKSECGRPEDKRLIFEVIRSTVGFEKLNSIVFAQLRHWMISEASKEVNSLGNNYSAGCIDMMFSLATLYESQGRYDEAKSLYVVCMQQRKAVLGKRHQKTLDCMNNLTLLCEKQGRHKDAERLLAKLESKSSPSAQIISSQGHNSRIMMGIGAEITKNRIWQCFVDGDWLDYSPEDAAIIDKEYSKHRTATVSLQLSFNCGHHTISVIDFASMLQINTETGTEQMIRFEISGFYHYSPHTRRLMLMSAVAEFRERPTYDILAMIRRLMDGTVELRPGEHLNFIDIGKLGIEMFPDSGYYYAYLATQDWTQLNAMLSH
jgi:hypothetical protein